VLFEHVDIDAERQRGQRGSNAGSTCSRHDQRPTGSDESLGVELSDEKLGPHELVTDAAGPKPAEFEEMRLDTVKGKRCSQSHGSKVQCAS